MKPYLFDFQVNSTISNLTLLESFYKGRRKFWKCMCICGKTVIRRQDYLGIVHRDGVIASCGCTNEAKIVGKRNVNWKGYGNISGYKFSQYKHGALRRDIKFEVTIEQIWHKFVAQDRKCALTGLEITINEYTKTKRNKSTASLDRKDPNGDYTLDNIQWVHKDINLIKNYFSEVKLFEYCKLIVQHNNLII